jgi:hypothetical protein
MQQQQQLGPPVGHPAKKHEQLTLPSLTVCLTRVNHMNTQEAAKVSDAALLTHGAESCSQQ